MSTEELQGIREEVAAAHELARQRMADRINKKFKPFKLHDKVWLEAKNLRLNTPNRKLAHKREGPFKIKKVLGPMMYKLELPKSWKIHPVFQAMLLMPYRETEAHGPNFTEPSPDLVQRKEEYEVEAILNHKRQGNG